MSRSDRWSWSRRCIPAAGSLVGPLMLAMLLVGAPPAAAQRVAGRVTDGTSGEPIPGAVVWLTDSAGAFLARAIGNTAGEYSVMRLVNAARLHVVRIGYRPRELAIPTHFADTTIDLVMDALPLVLDPVEASRRRVCAGAHGTEDALALWEQARAGLLATVVARDAEAPKVHLLSYTRRLGTTRSGSLKLAVRGRDLIADESYVAARPVWTFVNRGYMEELHGGDRMFYAPDAETLLDATFADTHCMHVVAEDARHPDEVGIGFEPVKGRDTIVDINGVLWLDRAKPQLRSLEFHYTSLEREARESGGEIRFRMMPNGAPMIERWFIRAAVLEPDANSHEPIMHRRPPDRWDRHDVVLVGYSETGGMVASAEWPDGKSWRADLPHIDGTVYSLTGGRVLNGRVWVDELPDTVSTDSLGHYSIRVPLPGIFTVQASTAPLARVALPLASNFAIIRGDAGAAEANLYAISIGALVRGRCTALEHPAGTLVSFGRVVDESGAPVGKASVFATVPPAVDSLPPTSYTATSDENGRFFFCGLATQTAFHLHAASTMGEADADIQSNTDLATVLVTVRPRASASRPRD